MSQLSIPSSDVEAKAVTTRRLGSGARGGLTEKDVHEALDRFFAQHQRMPRANMELREFIGGGSYRDINPAVETWKAKHQEAAQKEAPPSLPPLPAPVAAALERASHELWQAAATALKDQLDGERKLMETERIKAEQSAATAAAQADELQELVDTIPDLQRTLEETCTELEGAREEAQRLRGALGEAVEELERVRGELKAASTEVGRLRSELTQATEARSALQDALTEARNGLTRADGEAQQRRREFAAEKKAFEDALTDERRLRSSAESARAALETEMATLQGQVNTIGAERRAAEQRVADLDAALKRERSQHEQDTATAARLHTLELEAVEARATAAAAEAATATERAEKLAGMVADMEAAAAEAEERETTLMAEISKLKAAVQSQGTDTDERPEAK